MPRCDNTSLRILEFYICLTASIWPCGRHHRQLLGRYPICSEDDGMSFFGLDIGSMQANWINTGHQKNNDLRSCLISFSVSVQVRKHPIQIHKYALSGNVQQWHNSWTLPTAARENDEFWKPCPPQTPTCIWPAYAYTLQHVLFRGVRPYSSTRSEQGWCWSEARSFLKSLKLKCFQELHQCVPMELYRSTPTEKQTLWHGSHGHSRGARWKVIAKLRQTMTSSSEKKQTYAVWTPESQLHKNCLRWWD